VVRVLAPLILLAAVLSGIPPLVYCAAFGVAILHRRGQSTVLWPSRPWQRRAVVLGALSLLSAAALAWGGAE
jgi:hypothetical protein